MKAGRLLRAQMRDAAAETPARAAERIRAREAGERAVKDREARFNELTAANAAEALRYQEERIKYWMAALAAEETR